MFYTLDDNHQVISCDDHLTAFDFWEKNRRVRATKIRSPDGQRWWVSTVFLMIEHVGGFFETAIWDIGSDESFVLTRYQTYQHAAKSHKKIVRHIKHHGL